MPNLYEFLLFEALFQLFVTIIGLYLILTIFNFNDYWKLKQEYKLYLIIYSLYLIVLPLSLYFFIKLKYYNESFLLFMFINVITHIITWNISITYVVYISEHINYKLYMLSDLPTKHLKKYKKTIQ